MWTADNLSGDRVVMHGRNNKPGLAGATARLELST